MPEHEAFHGAVYDHEREEPSRRGRRRVDDWGVGDELFDRLPSRRFVRGDVSHARPRRGMAHPADTARRALREGGAEHASPPRRDPERGLSARGDSEGAPSPGAPAQPSSPIRDVRGHTDAPPRHPSSPADARPRPLSSPPAEATTTPDLMHPPADAALYEVPAAPARVEVAGRRTVVISGRPGPLGRPPARRRPPRTAHERVGSSPDRIVAWTVALGVLLILIAILTAH